MKAQALSYDRRQADSRVLCDGNDVLRRYQARIFSYYALTRKQLRSLSTQSAGMMEDLTWRGEMRGTFKVGNTKKMLRGRDPTVVIRGSKLDYDEYAIYCEGDLADEIVTRVNTMQRRKLIKMIERRERKVAAPPPKKRDQEKRRKREESRKARQKPAPVKKLRSRFLELFAKNNVKPQLKHHTITWHDVPYATAWIFKINSTIYRTASQRAESRLFNTLEHGDGRLATRTKDGFTICFEVVGKWRGDLTEIRIAFTDNNKHPLYRRSRDYFKQFLIGAAQKREHILRPRASDMIKIAA